MSRLRERFWLACCDVLKAIGRFDSALWNWCLMRAARATPPPVGVSRGDGEPPF